MKQAKYKREPSRTLNLQVSKRMKEGGVIVVVALAFFLLLTLITYHISDPGWSRTGTGGKIANVGGFIGAWVADVLLYVFGFIAYLFPLLLSYLVWSPASEFDAHNKQGGVHLLLLRLVGIVLLVAAGSSLASLYFTGGFLPAGAGGIVGYLLSGALVGELNRFGTGLLLLTLFLTGVTWFSGLSWLQVIDMAGRGGLKLIDGLGSLVYKLVVYVRSREPKAKKAKVVIHTAKEEVQAIPKPMVKQDKPPKIKSTVDHDFTPSLELLDEPQQGESNHYTREQLETASQEVEECLQDFAIDAKVVAVHPGPVVTRFELELAAGTKVNKITALVKDLARSLSVISVRIVEVIPGKSVIGLELPNAHREIVRLREILDSKQYRHTHSPLTIALGKDISGHSVVVDLAKMPHLLIAGTTGSGKSVGLNAILLSLLYKYSPNHMRLILIDPKMLELSVYAKIPHLLAPVVTDMKEAANALRWCVAEMERRYKLMASLGVRNIIGFNNKIRDAKEKGAPILDPLWDENSEREQPELEPLPYIVVFADEYADMIMVVGKKVEELIARIAQKARAAGIHLVLATQRPSVDVITGLIKANIPCRIAFQVSSKVDSRTIIDQMGAEQLLGYGDMLYLPPGTVIPTRVHGAFVSDDEVHKVVKELRNYGDPEYLAEILATNHNLDLSSNGGAMEMDDPEQDPIYDQAVEFVCETRKVSISSIQRRFKIGYNRAARIVEAMEAAKLVSPMHNGVREILIPED